MQSGKIAAVLSVGVWVLFTNVNTMTVANEDDDHRGNAKILMLDDCDPRVVEGGWNTATDNTECERKEGSVSRAEFRAFLRSPFSLSVIGHPAWTNSPTYTIAEEGEKIRVRNAGGRGHTFTEVAEYGGGFVGGFNIGLVPAPECAAALDAVVRPGDHIVVKELALGNHKFMCCAHPWMRALIKVEPAEDDNEEDTDKEK